MRTWVAAGAWAIALVSAAAHAQLAGTLKVDAVELVAGREVAGQESIHADHHRYRYLFSSEANKAEFLKDPARYEIQLGGACGRMGPLSGEGSPDRRLVHEGRIYIFASDACRKAFEANAAKLLDRDDPAPTGTPEQMREGLALIEKAVAAFGGAERVDGLKSYSEEFVENVESGGKTYRHRKAWILGASGALRLEEEWDDWKWAAVRSGEEAWFSQTSSTGRESWNMHPQQVQALEREFRHHPLVILRARKSPGFVAVAGGAVSADVGGRTVELKTVTVGFGGKTDVLGIDVETGRVLTQRYRGRNSNLMFTELDRVFEDYRAAGGVVVPHQVAASSEGKPVKNGTYTLAAVQVNAAVEAGFRRD
ncbi:MAG: hypothetical protein FLDDKLPJ_00991 [Phycisphaerae bacterium]|nr:hypothetical protein [Phycisphaerae bacterium]